MSVVSKLKATVKENIVSAKLRIAHPMLSTRQAKRRGIEQDYVVDIVAYVGEREVFHFVPTEWISRNPMFRFKFKKIDVDIGDTLIVRWKTLRGKTETVSCKIE
jgi:sulfur-oxidizing protein SoxZ